MIKGGLPPFKKLNKALIKINQDTEFYPDLLLPSLLINTKRKEEEEEEEEEEDK
tara:strand:- start:256 stop:417 length:162 start_codon:yes stop_codon:yes gene_type:complete